MVDVAASPVPENDKGEAPILDVRDLEVAFQTLRGVVHAVNGVSLSIKAREALGILGESGSGKSVSVGAVMGLLESPPAQIEGKITYRGTDLLGAGPKVTRSIRGDRISMVYQDAITSLDPGLTVGYQIGELFTVHRPGTPKRIARAKSIELMERVGIHSANERVDSYPMNFRAV